MFSLAAATALEFSETEGRRGRKGAGGGELYYAISGNLCTFPPSSPLPPSPDHRRRSRPVLVPLPLPPSRRSPPSIPSGFFLTVRAPAAAFLSSFGAKFSASTSQATKCGECKLTAAPQKHCRKRERKRRSPERLFHANFRRMPSRTWLHYDECLRIKCERRERVRKCIDCNGM